MTRTDLPGLVVTVTDGVATVRIDHPPLNLLDGVLLPSLRAFITSAAGDPQVRVVVFESADPDFFLAHGDMRFITDPDVVARAGAAAIAVAPDVPIPETLNLMQVVHEELRALPQITIGKIEGFARGGGNEFLMALDMRFAAIGRSGQAQPETAMGIIPGGGGTQYLTSLVGRPRALELVLGGELVDARLAAEYGLVNRAVPADEIDDFVDALAKRIARRSPEVIAAAKLAIDAAVAAPSIGIDGLSIENGALTSLFTADTAALAQRQLAAGVQTRDGERDLERLLNSM